MALYGEFVERQVRVGLFGEVARDGEQRAGFGGELPGRDPAEQFVESGIRGAGEEPEVAGVDTQDGNRGAAEPVYALEQRAVAAVADHDRLFGSCRSKPLAIDMFGGDLPSGELPHDGNELLVYGIFGPEAADRIEQQADLFGRTGNLRAGKSMIFIGGVSKK